MKRSAYDEFVDGLIKTYTKKADDDFTVAANDTIGKLYKEAWNMYDSFIDQFYSVPTKSYVRHGMTRPGVGGINLYKGQNITMGKGRNPFLLIDFSGSDMDGGYQFDTPDKVLEYVMFGIRFPYFNQASSWTGSYKGKYFSYTGTLRNAFNMFADTFEDIARPIFFKKWKSLGWN